MRPFCASLLCFTFAFALSAQGADSTAFGRYVGTLTHDRLGSEQLVKLDFVVGQNDGNKIDLKAVLTLHFGDFTSGEYVSYHFDRVQYDLLLGKLIFDQPEEDVTITSSKFSQGELIADFRSSALGKVGVLKLRQSQPAQPSLPIVEPLNGEYEGVCKSERVRLQLHTLRSVEDSSRVGNPFGAFDIKGQYGVVNDSLCMGMDPKRACQRFAIKNGSYQFFSGELTLVGDFESLNCKVTSAGLECANGCTLKRVSPENKSRVFSPPQAAPAFSSENGTAGVAGTSLAGEYRGFLHHEYLNRYQPAQITVVTYQESKGAEKVLRISVGASLSFGATFANETLTYRFEPRDFPSPLVQPRFILSRLGDDVDAFLKVTAIGNGVIRGEWHSLIFGRVGTFEVRKSELSAVTIPANALTFTPLSGNYDEQSYQMQLKVFQNRTPPNTENPFFPLDIGGWMRLKSGGARENILGGSYDFYTGKVGLRWKDDRWIIGRRNGEQHLDLLTITNVFGSLMPYFSPAKKFLRNPL